MYKFGGLVNLAVPAVENYSYFNLFWVLGLHTMVVCFVLFFYLTLFKAQSVWDILSRTLV